MFADTDALAQITAAFAAVFILLSIVAAGLYYTAGNIDNTAWEKTTLARKAARVQTCAYISVMISVACLGATLHHMGALNTPIVVGLVIGELVILCLAIPTALDAV